jgi:peptide/nickel transport system substrate-binding protein
MGLTYTRATALSLLTGVLLLASCAPATSQAPGAPAERPAPVNQTLVIIDRGEPPSLATRSLVSSAGVGLGGSQVIFNATLVQEDEMLELRPYLAEAVPRLNTDSWRVLPDGRMELSYRLRPGLTWHDGAPLTTEDFLFAWRVYSTPAFGASASPIVDMEDVVATDASSLVIRWRQPYPEAAQDTLPALPRHLLGQAFQEQDAQAFMNSVFWTNEYIGSGPYRLERREPGVSIDGVAFGGYVFGKPRIDRVRIRFVSDPNAAVANLLAGSAHYVTRFLLYDQEGTTLHEQWTARGGGGSVIWRPTLPRMWLIQLRPEHANPRELTDVRMRRGLMHAIDSQALVDVMTGGRGVVSGSITSPLVSYRSLVEQGLTRYPYDPRAAQRLFETAGLVRGSDGPYASPIGGSFTLELWHVEGATNARENTVIAENLSRVGIAAAPHIFSVALAGDNQARATTPGLFSRGASNGEALLRDFTIASLPTPENRWRGGNRSGWVSEPFSRVFDAYSVALDRSERVKHIAEMERIFSQELPAFGLYYTPEVTAYSAGLNGPTDRLAPEPSQPLSTIHTWEWR